MKEPCVIFRLGERDLGGYSIRGTFPGELKATIELLAYENGVQPEDIRWTIENR